MIAQRIESAWRQPTTRRWLTFGLVATAVFLMAFYALTNPEYLHAHDVVLSGGDWLGGAICHRLVERSFVINGRSFPLCARCTGMYLGVATTFAVVALAGRIRYTELSPWPILLVLVGFIGLMGVDGLNSFAHFFPNAPHLYTPRNDLRLITGMGTGVTMGLFMWPVLAQTLWANGTRRPMIGSFGELGMVLVVAITAVMLLLSNEPTLSYVLAVASVLGILLIVTTLNAVFLLTLLRKERWAKRWRETAVPLLICLLLAVGELSLISFLRLQLFGTITGVPGL